MIDVQFAGRKQDLPRLAELLIEANLITRWQADKLLAGVRMLGFLVDDEFALDPDAAAKFLRTHSSTAAFATRMRSSYDGASTKNGSG